VKYFYSFFSILLALSFNSIFNFFVTEAAQYECSYRRTAHQPLTENRSRFAEVADVRKSSGLFFVGVTQFPTTRHLGGSLSGREELARKRDSVASLVESMTA